MELRQLRYFVAVAEELHFSRAAARLHMTQPPLSKQIRLLEEDLGTTLFFRTRQEVHLTPEGQLFLGRARDLLSQSEQAREAVRLAGQGNTGVLTIAYYPGLEIRVIPRVLRLFRRRYPGVNVRLVPATTAEQSESLSRRRINAGFILLPARNPALAVQRIGNEALILVASKDHPLGKCPGTPIAKIQDEPFILLSRPFAPIFHDLVISAARSAGVTLRIVAEARSIHENLSLVASGLGVSLLPSAVRDIPWKGVGYCPVEASAPPVEIGVASRKDDTSALTQNFLRVVKQLYRVA